MEFQNRCCAHFVALAADTSRPVHLKAHLPSSMAQGSDQE